MVISWKYGQYKYFSAILVEQDECFNAATNCYSLIGSGLYAEDIDDYNLEDGDIIQWNYIVNQYNADYGYLFGNSPHSAIVHKYTDQNNDEIIEYISKWGEYAVYIHDLTDHPYSEEPFMDGTIHNTWTLPRTFSIYRPLHSSTAPCSPLITDYLIIDENYHGVMCSGCGRHLVNTVSHNMVTHGSISRCTVCGYREFLLNNIPGDLADE